MIAANSLAPHAPGALIIDVSEVSFDVVATASGTINLSALHSIVGGGASATISPDFAAVIVGSPGPVAFDVYASISGPAAFGSGDALATSGSGGLVGVVGSFGAIYVPTGYVFGETLSASSTFSGQSIASLGLTPGS